MLEGGQCYACMFTGTNSNPKLERQSSPKTRFHFSKAKVKQYYLSATSFIYPGGKLIPITWVSY